MEEHSAGAIVFIKNEKIEYLLLYRKPNPPFKESWDFPRGFIEPGEAEIETVVREIKEETGIAYLKFIKSFHENIQFFYRKDGQLIRKTIAYFLAETNKKEVILSSEHNDFAWLGIDDALARLRHKSSKELLEKAHRILIG